MTPFYLSGYLPWCLSICLLKRVRNGSLIAFLRHVCSDHIRCTQVIDPQKPQAQHYSSSGRWKRSLPLIYYPMHICQICMSWHHVKEKNWKGQLGAASHEKAVMSLTSQAGGSHDIGETWNVFYDEQQLWCSLSSHLSALSRVTASWAFWKLICFYSSFKYNLWM